jgi:hypothetical protein
MSIVSVGGRSADGRRVHGRVVWLVCACAVLALVVATTAMATQGPVGGEVAASAAQPSYAGISNGTLRLGINPEGHIDAIVDGDEWLGLEYTPTGAEGLINGCWCEGWGVADRNASLSGWASVANGGVSPNVTVKAFDVTGETADSTVEIGGALRVRHRFHPSSRPELYELDVTVENLGTSVVDVVYRRAMDWDVPPTEFSEYVTIQGAHSRLLDSTDYGFQNVNPLLPLYDLGARGTFEDVGPDDRGSAFDFGLGTLAPGASASLTLFYGAASSEADALAALDAVGARLYSLGQPSTPDGPTLGTPNTFMFGAADGVVGTGPVIVTGQLVLPKGVEGPVGGSVALYLPSTAVGLARDTLVATATSAADGTFTLRADPSPELIAAAAANDGQVNLDLVANANGWVYNHAVVRSLVDSSWVDEQGLAPGALALFPVNGAVMQTLIPGAAAGAKTGSTAYGGCATWRLPLSSTRAWTTIGELHTPADTDVASFTYGRKADSYVSKAISLDGTLWKLVGGSIRVGDDANSGSSTEAGVSHGLDRWAREIQTEFVYTRYESTLVCGGLTVASHFEIRPTDWVGNVRTGADLRHLDDRCDEEHAQYVAPYGKNASVERNANRYGTFVGAATVTFGGISVALNARSGMSQYVRVSWKFGSKGTKHVLCGIDALLPNASRIFAGG